MAQSFQTVSSISCPDGNLVVDARPFNQNEAGSSAVDIRYRYKDRELDAIRYELYYKNLETYLRQGGPPIYNFGLNLDTSGASRTHGYDSGDTLYLPPSAFSRAEVDRLANCIVNQHQTIRRDFERAEISSQAFLGLMKTRASLGVNGIARIVHADAPIAGLYGSHWYIVVVERGGRVLLHTNATANSAPESAMLGQVIPRPDGKRVLRAKPGFIFAGKERVLTDYQLDSDRHGRRLKDDYLLETGSPGR